jgi:hypothetical protein
MVYVVVLAHGVPIVSLLVSDSYSHSHVAIAHLDYCDRDAVQVCSALAVHFQDRLYQSISVRLDRQHVILVVLFSVLASAMSHITTSNFISMLTVATMLTTGYDRSVYTSLMQ